MPPELTSRQLRAVLAVARFLAANPAKKVDVIGHTCDLGTREYNLGLSRVRAGFIGGLLVAAGIDGGRLDVVGKGESAPLVEGTSEAARAQNRRVEIREGAG